jgi:DNA-binding transcriptional regulator YhcF (GntR family)
MPTVVTGNKVPLYQQVSQNLKQQVRTGQYKANNLLPSVRMLSHEYGVSLNVIQRAIRVLEEDGVVATHPSKGMVVLDGTPCQKAASVFAFIQPYSAGMGFEQDVLSFAEQAFSERDNFMVVRSSHSNPNDERAIAEHLIQNNIQGILLWPVDNDPNGLFFKSLSKRVPIVLVDRKIEGMDLPLVLHDTYGAGRDVVQTMLEGLGRKRILAVVDNLKISPYQELIRGFQDQANEMDRMADLTILQLPISEFINQINISDFSQVNKLEKYLERLLKEGGYDAFFCQQDEFIEYVLIETGLYDRFRHVQLGTMHGKRSNNRSRKFNQAGVLIWTIDFGKAITLAADILQEWFMSRKRVSGVTQVKIDLKMPNNLECPRDNFMNEA